MDKICLIANLKRKWLEWDNSIVPMKGTGNLLRKPDITNNDIRELVIVNTEPVYTGEETDIVSNILDIKQKIVDIGKLIYR